MNNRKNPDLENNREEEVNKAKVSSSAGIFIVIGILTVVTGLLLVGYFFAIFVNW